MPDQQAPPRVRGEEQRTARLADDPGRPRSAARILADSRELTIPALRAAVGTLPARMRRVVGYHFGWLDERGRPAGPGDEGKMLRSALALLSAQAVGGRAEDAVPAAVAVELIHNFTMLHDDVMDGDPIRRHRPTVWKVFGVPTAVLAGDFLWALAIATLRECGEPVAGKAVRILSEALDGLLSGQDADLDFETRTHVGVDEYVDMAAGKTGALQASACGLGALLGGGSPGQITCLREFGRQLGIAFQCIDDLLGIWGDATVTGKPVRSDLANRKKSLPVVAAMTTGTPQADELAALYRLDRAMTPAELDHAADLIEATGARAWTKRAADHHVTEALSCLRAAEPVPRLGNELADLATFVTHRDR